MIKIYYKNTIIFLTSNYKTNFINYKGLFYSYSSKKEFIEFWRHFEIICFNVDNLFIIHEKPDEVLKIFINDIFTFIEAAGGVILNSKNEILFIKRFGKWDLPKGKIDDNETPTITALREVSEECGISGLKIIRPLQSTYHYYSMKNRQILKRTYWYVMKYEGNEICKPQIEEDITEVRWFDKKDLVIVFQNTYNAIVDVLNDAGLLPI